MEKKEEILGILRENINGTVSIKDGGGNVIYNFKIRGLSPDFNVAIDAMLLTSNVPANTLARGIAEHLGEFVMARIFKGGRPHWN